MEARINCKIMTYEYIFLQKQHFASTIVTPLIIMLVCKFFGLCIEQLIKHISLKLILLIGSHTDLKV